MSESDPSRQRLLEHALYEVLGGDAQDAPDLARQIREAWEGGDRIPADADDPAPPTALPEASPRTPGATPRRWIPWTAAAAAVLAAGGAMLWPWNPAETTSAPGPQVIGQGERPPTPTAHPEDESSRPENGVSRKPQSISLSPELLARAQVVALSLDEFKAEGMPPEIVRELIDKDYREGSLAELRLTPALWPEVAPSLERLLSPERLPLYARTAFVEALVLDPSPVAMERVRSLWLEQPEAFTIDTVVTMAERGAFEFEREAEAWLESFRPEEPKASLPGEPLTGAIYAALRGDDRAAPILEAELSRDPDGDHALLAAVGLARLGRQMAWLNRFDSYVATLQDQLDRDDLSSEDEKNLPRRIDGLSYAIALLNRERLELFEPTAEWDGEPRVGDLTHWIELYREARSREPRDRKALAAELESLLRR